MHVRLAHRRLPECCRFLWRWKAFFPFAIKESELLEPKHSRNPPYLSSERCSCTKYLASKRTFTYSVFKLGHNRNGGNDFYIINEAGFVLILIESVLSSFALGSFIYSFNATVSTQMVHIKCMHIIHSPKHAVSGDTQARTC